ncbi:MAG: DUF4340 domain-containing protein [Methylacidiphilales bacterium]|nr:DUF4340 domain-containing protein [Candidatus Methylacidiphilales bacterium]
MLRNRSTLVYLALFLGLVCYLTFIDKKIPGTKEREEAETELFKLNPDDVTGLEVSNVHGQFIFKKDNNHWEIRKPVDTPADSPTVDSIVNQIASAQPLAYITADKFNDSTLKEWGLMPPAERVFIHTNDKQYELLIGRKVAINDSVYARASGRKNEPVRILPSMVKDVLQKDLSDFRSRSVFDFDLDKVTKVASRIADTATAPAQQNELELKDGKWTLEMPLVARASEPDVQGMLNNILALRVIDFVTDTPSNVSQYGLTSPVATLSVTLKDGSEMVLQIGSAVPTKPNEVYAQRLKSNSVFTIAKATADALLSAVPSVRDRHVLPFTPAQATGLTISIGSNNIQLHKEDNVWKTAGDAAGLADMTKVNDILAKLSQLETTPLLKDSAPDLKPYGLDKPKGKITVQSPEFKPGPSLTLFIGKTENKVTYIRNSTEPFIYTLADHSLDFLPANNFSLRDTQVINLRRELVKSMTITVGTTPSVTLTRSSGGTWSTANVKERMVDSTKADTQASLFCQLQARSWLGPVQSSYGLSKPVLRIAVETDKPAATVLRIGAKLPDGNHAAQVEGDSLAFELAEGDYDILNASSLELIPSVLSATNAPSATPPPAKK